MLDLHHAILYHNVLYYVRLYYTMFYPILYYTLLGVSQTGGSYQPYDRARPDAADEVVRSNLGLDALLVAAASEDVWGLLRNGTPPYSIYVCISKYKHMIYRISIDIHGYMYAYVCV